MGSVKQYMRPGEYNGITYGIEVWELETGNLVVNSIYLGSLSGRKLLDGQRREFGCVEDAFLYGAEFARNLIETEVLCQVGHRAIAGEFSSRLARRLDVGQGCGRNGSVMRGGYTVRMLQCIRCQETFAGFSQVEPSIDSFGMHFICPKCGRRNGLKTVGHDGSGLLVEQCESKPRARHRDRIAPGD